MQIRLVDSRRLGVTIQRADARYWNPATTGWEAPFDHTKHMIPFKSVDSASPILGTVQTADIGNELVQRQDCAAIILILDKTGAPTAALEAWTLPSPIPNPTVGGFPNA